VYESAIAPLLPPWIDIFIFIFIFSGREEQSGIASVVLFVYKYAKYCVRNSVGPISVHGRLSR